MAGKFLEIGKIVAVQGLKGEVRVETWCDGTDFFAALRFFISIKGKLPCRLKNPVRIRLLPL